MTVPRHAARRLGLLLLVLALPVLAGEGTESELERNARLLLRWKQDPEHYARLKRDYQAFAELPPERQATLRKLDRDLAALEATPQRHLLHVLDRFAAFLETLSESDRQRLEAAQGKERLALIVQFRQQHWFNQLPFKLREDLNNLPDEKRGKELQAIQEEDRRRKNLLATNKGRPVPWPKLEGKNETPRPRPITLHQYPPDVIEFINTHIKPRLTMEELRRLDDTDGKVGLLAALLLEYAERYPVLPPIYGKEGPTDYLDLPVEVRQKLNNKGLLKNWPRYKLELEQHRKQWPQFALAVVGVFNAAGIPMPLALGASRAGEFAPDVQSAIRRLPEADRLVLQSAEGKWPEYPRKLHDLARKAEIVLPGMTIPGSRAFWDGLKKEK